MEHEQEIAARAVLLIIAGAASGQVNRLAFEIRGAVMTLDGAADWLARARHRTIIIDRANYDGVFHLSIRGRSDPPSGPLATAGTLVEGVHEGDILFQTSQGSLRVSDAAWQVLVDRYDIQIPFTIAADPATREQIADGYSIHAKVGPAGTISRAVNELDIDEPLRSVIKREFERMKRDSR